MMCALGRACVSVIHWHCSAQLSMFNMEKRYRNKIIIIITIIIIILTSVLYDCLDEIIPRVTSIMNKSLSSSIVPQSCSPTCPPSVHACKCNSTAQITPLASSDG